MDEPFSYAWRAMYFALPLLVLLLAYGVLLVLVRGLARWRRSPKRFRGKVVNVIDGKQLEIDAVRQSGSEVKRLVLAHMALAQDLPEYSRQCHDYLNATLRDRHITFTAVAQVESEHDMILAIVHEPVDVAAELIRNGLCYARMDAPESYRQLQEDAQREGRGLWRSMHGASKGTTTRLNR